MEETLPVSFSSSSSTSASSPSPSLFPLFPSLSYENKQNCIRSLHNAAKHGDLLTVMALIEYQKVPIDSLDDRHFTPLMHAAEKGRESIVEYLIQQGANVNAKEEFGDSPLVFAASWSHVHIVHALLMAGADVNTMDAEQDTPLTIAAAEGHTQVCSILLKHQARIDIVNETGWTPLEAAVENGHPETVALLLDEGNADPTGKLTHEAPRTTTTTVVVLPPTTSSSTNTNTNLVNSTKRTLSSSLLSVSSEDLPSLVPVSPLGSVSSSTVTNNAVMGFDSELLLLENEGYLMLPPTNGNNYTNTSTNNGNNITINTNGSDPNISASLSAQRRLRRRYTMRDGRILARARELAAVEAVTLLHQKTESTPATTTNGTSSSSTSVPNSTNVLSSNESTTTTTPYADVLARILGCSRWRRRGFILLLYSLIIQNRAVLVMNGLPYSSSISKLTDANNSANGSANEQLSIVSEKLIHQRTVDDEEVYPHRTPSNTTNTNTTVSSIISSISTATDPVTVAAGEAIVRLTSPCVPFDVVKRILSFV
jgi:ankyrin repeat protein